MTGDSPTSPTGPGAGSLGVSINNRSRRTRSRTSTLTSVNNLAPIMSRENSKEDVKPLGDQQEILLPSDVGTDDRGFARQLSQSLQENSQMRPGSPSRLTIKPNRRPSKSVSSSRPPTLNKRTQSYHNSKTSYSGPAASAVGPPSPSPRLLPTPADTPSRNGLKRRTSTPSLAIHLLPEEGEDMPIPPPIPEAGPSFKGKEKEKDVDNRARSKSTSIAYPPSLESNPTIVHPRRPPSPLRLPNPLPAPQWTEPHRANLAVPDHTGGYRPPDAALPPNPTSLLTRAYDIGESSLVRLASWVKPGSNRNATLYRRSSEDSERGQSDEGEPSGSLDSVGTTRTSAESYRNGQGRGRYWGLSDEDEDGGYFSLPPTPPDEVGGTSGTEYPPFSFGTAGGGSLPTPALSTRSLSRHQSQRRRAPHSQSDDAGHGWLRHLLSFGSGTKTGQVIRELGWTVGILGLLFFVTLGLVLWLVRGMPVTTLKHLPKSTTDLQLLSAEIRSYMASGDPGWYHTIGVLIFVGCWKHAWSVPGAVVLNILVGSILEPMAALALLTFITATGSLLSYMLSRPLAPLIAVLFPKPLALVRAALAPESIPSPPTAQAAPKAGDPDYVTPVQLASDPAAAPIGGPSPSSSQAVWRRLLVMRAMGFVPWSGMNVACGVVGDNWKTFWLTTAAGSASWSYVTASVGNILSRLALPQAAALGNLDSTTPEAMAMSVGPGAGGGGGGESLTSLLRDPVLIAKLVFLTALTLLPVVVKRRSAPAHPDPPAHIHPNGINGSPMYINGKPINPSVGSLRFSGTHVAAGNDQPPMSPITQSLARFTPTPAVFDLLSFGRTAIRQGGRVVQLGMRGVSEGAGRAAAAVRR